MKLFDQIETTLADLTKRNVTVALERGGNNLAILWDTDEEFSYYGCLLSEATKEIPRHSFSREITWSFF